MFKLCPAPTFAAPVNLTVPGESEPGVVVFTFKHMGREALAEWMARPSQMDGKPVTDVEYLGQVIAGWSGVSDDAGQPAPCTPQALDALLDAYPASGREIFAAYVKALTESRAKNCGR